jgi:hypothetical protein
MNYYLDLAAWSALYVLIVLVVRRELLMRRCKRAAEACRERYFDAQYRSPRSDSELDAAFGEWGAALGEWQRAITAPLWRWPP